MAGLLILVGMGMMCFGAGALVQSEAEPFPSYRVPWLQLGIAATGALMAVVGMVI